MQRKANFLIFFFVTANVKSGTEIVITTRYAAPRRAREEKAACQWAWKKERKGLGLESLRAQSGLRLHQRALMKNPSWRERKIQCSLEQKTRFLRAQFVEAPSSQQCILKLCSFARTVYANENFRGLFVLVFFSAFGPLLYWCAQWWPLTKTRRMTQWP